MEEQHPHLAYKDWKVDVKAISADDIRNGNQASIPVEFKKELTCWVIFFDGDASNVVYLLQDKEFQCLYEYLRAA